MKIRWMLIAKESRLNGNGTLDIGRVFENYRADGPPYNLDFQILMKIVPDPILAGTTIKLTLRIAGPDTDYEETIFYEYPNFTEWLEGWTPFFRIFQSINLLNPGEYAIELLEGEEHLAIEGLRLFDSEEDSDAAFQGQER